MEDKERSQPIAGPSGRRNSIAAGYFCVYLTGTGLFAHIECSNVTNQGDAAAAGDRQNVSHTWR